MPVGAVLVGVVVVGADWSVWPSRPSGSTTIAGWDWPSAPDTGAIWKWNMYGAVRICRAPASRAVTLSEPPGSVSGRSIWEASSLRSKNMARLRCWPFTGGRKTTTLSTSLTLRNV